MDALFGYLNKWITDWGPGLVIALIMLYGLYKLLLRLGKDVGMKILGALEKPATALNSQAQSMDRLTHSLEEFVNRDRSEHREIIILQKVTNERLEHVLDKLEESLEDNDDDRDKKRTL